MNTSEKLINIKEKLAMENSEHDVKKTPISIITGYLGSGKTTLLRHILKNTKSKIAILMNEFGEIAIDSKIVKGKAVEIAELLGGCVCCSLIGEFSVAVKEIIEKAKPELIIVETTGVAEPDSLITDIEENIKEVKLDSVITVVDADGMIKFPSLGETGRIQIEMADIILLNKIDLVSNEQIEEVENKIREINNFAIIERTVNCEVNLNILFGVEVEKIIAKREHNHLQLEETQSFSFETEKSMDRNKFEEFLGTMPKEVYRIKGFVKFEDETYLFNYVAGRWGFEKFNSDKTIIVFIGKNISVLKNEILQKIKEREV